MNNEYINIVINNFGIKRCMFASNFPVDKFISQSSYSSFWSAYFTIISNLNQDEINDLFVKNAEQFYKI